MRRLVTVCCGLILVLQQAGALEAQVFRPGPVGGGGMSLGPVGGGLPTGFGQSGPNGLGGVSLPDLGRTSLPDLGPTPTVQFEAGSHRASSAQESYVSSEQSTADEDYVRHDAAPVGPTVDTADDVSGQPSRNVHAGGPPDEEGSDEDDDEGDGLPWWLWLVVALTALWLAGKRR